MDSVYRHSFDGDHDSARDDSASSSFGSGASDAEYDRRSIARPSPHPQHGVGIRASPLVDDDGRYRRPVRVAVLLVGAAASWLLVGAIAALVMSVF